MLPHEQKRQRNTNPGQEVQGRKAVEIKRTRDILQCLDSTKVYRK